MARQKMLSNCNCRDKNELFFGDDDKLEAELNLTCPAHGERILGRMLHFVVVDEKGNEKPKPRRDQLVEEYERRRARQLRAGSGRGPKPLKLLSHMTILMAQPRANHGFA